MSIVLCVPFMKPHKKHIPHLMEFYALNKAKHSMHLHWEAWRPLHKVQANAVQVARELKASHILFTEDDQWGYPVDGLDVLLEADKDVVALATYTKEPPFLPMTFRKIDPLISMLVRAKNLVPTWGTQPCEAFDLITWAFTLVRLSVFDRLEGDPFRCWDEVPTDSHFCHECERVGIPRYVLPSFIINHGDTPYAEIGFRRRAYDAMCASRGIFGKDAVVLEQDHDDVVYRTEFQEAIMPVHEPDLTAEGVA